MSGLRVKGLRKTFGKNTVIHDLNFEVAEGEFCILLGPSGCGKSTVLRLIAGLERQDRGEIYIGDTRVDELTPKERDVAMVFQSYALYPHMTVYENIAFPLRMKKVPRAVVEEKVAAAAELLGLTELLERKPAELSGGQRQRVAMGRAIVRSPRLFLFDEPLSNLDAKLRTAMRVELAALHKKLGITVVYVTHDQVEAMTLAHRIILLDEGRIQQVGTPRELYEKPRNIFVATFIGSPQINLMEGRLVPEGGGVFFRSGDVSLEIPSGAGLEGFAGKDVTLGIRPESLTPNEGPLKGTVELVEHIGSESIVYVRAADGTRFAAKAAADFEGRAGEPVSLGVDTRNLHLFHNGERIGL